MINVIKERKGDLLTVRLSGSLVETANLEQVIGPPAPLMQVYCKEIARTNSAGVKIWVRYFNDCEKAGSKISFHECSPTIVEQLNFMREFMANGTVASITMPFNCALCKTNFLSVYNTEDAKKLDHQNLDQKCPKCGGVAAFDDFAEEYFAFLDRIQA